MVYFDSKNVKLKQVKMFYSHRSRKLLAMKRLIWPETEKISIQGLSEFLKEFRADIKAKKFLNQGNFSYKFPGRAQFINENLYGG